MRKTNYYWNSGIFIVLFIVILFYSCKTDGPVETNWSKVKTTMLANNDIEKIVVVNNKQANIYIKASKIEKYEQEFSENYSKPDEAGPHFRFNIGSVEMFERNLQEAQKEKVNEILPEYKEERPWAGEIFWSLGPFLLLILIGIPVYFIPTWIGRHKKHYRSILVFNLLAGWSIVGWVGALFWALNSPAKKLPFEYICKKCGYKKSIDQQVKLFVCSNCSEENIIEDL